jgi:hypothetical protein
MHLDEQLPGRGIGQRHFAPLEHDAVAFGTKGV